MTTPLSEQQKKFTQGDGISIIQKYKELSVGESSFLFWLLFEITALLFSNLSGVIGLALRMLFYPPFLNQCGKRPAIGRGISIKNPTVITLGNTVLIDENVALEAKGKDSAIQLGDCVSIGRNSIIVAKEGYITFKNGVNVGSNCRIATQSKVTIGESTLIAAYSYIGPGNHQRGEGNKALIEEKMEIKGGVTIGARCWIGAHTTIMDGVTIGDDAIVGAHSFVNENVPSGVTVVGVPAKVLPKK